MDLVEVVEIDVCVACRVDEVARLEAANLGHHHAEQSVGSDVEGDAEEAVGTSLVELQRELASPILPLGRRGDIELEESMARRQVHVLEVGHVPS